MSKSILNFITFFILIALGCNDAIVNDQIKQSDLAKEFIVLLHQGKFENAYNYLDSIVIKSYPYEEFNSDISYITSISKKYGTEVELVNSDQYFYTSENNDLKMMSLIEFSFVPLEGRSDSPLTFNFKFNPETNKIIDFRYSFNYREDRMKVPFGLKKGLAEKTLFYYDEWQIGDKKIILNSISLALFSNNECAMIIKIAHDIDDNITDSEALVMARPIAMYSLDQGHFSKAKKVSLEKNLYLNNEIGVSFWRERDGKSYTVYVDTTNLR